MPSIITVDKDSKSIKNAYSPALGGSGIPEFVLGDTKEIDIYIVNSSKQLVSYSGDNTYGLKVSLGKVGSTPTGGTFTLTYGANTTAALAFDITAAALETALNALASVTAAGFVDVIGTVGGFKITFRVNGARTAITGSSVDLSPASAVSNYVAVAGDGSTASIQALRIRQTVIAYQDTWTIVQDSFLNNIGWRGILDTRTVETMLQLAGSSSVTVQLEVELTDPSGNIATLMQQDVTLRNDTIDSSTLITLALPDFLTTTSAAALYIPLTQKAAASGVATLDAGGKIPVGQLPASAGTGDMLKTDNLSGLSSTATSRTNLGLGTMAVATATDYLAKSGNLAGLASTLDSITNIGLKGLRRVSGSEFEFLQGAHYDGAQYIADDTTACGFVFGVGIIYILHETGLTNGNPFTFNNPPKEISSSDFNLVSSTITGCGGVSFSGTGAADTRTALGLVIGSTVQGYSSNLQAIPKSKYNGTVAPAVTDDDTLGYSVGSNWYNTTADDAYVCLDNTTGAAVWKKATP